MGKVIWEVISGFKPDFLCIEKHTIPALAPVLPTQAIWFLVEMATVLGKSPIVSTGLPIWVSFVGS